MNHGYTSAHPTEMPISMYGLGLSEKVGSFGSSCEAATQTICWSSLLISTGWSSPESPKLESPKLAPAL